MQEYKILKKIMLDELAKGREKSRFILIYDTVESRGNCLLEHITQELLKRVDVVVAFVFDEHPNDFQKKFSNEPRLVCHDGFSDPLNWNKESLDEDCIKSPFYLKRTVEKLLKNKESCLQQLLVTGQPFKIGIIINSLSKLITQQDVTTVCRDLLEVTQWKTNACDIIQTVALLHTDLHEENVLSSLNYMASTTIELQKSKNRTDDFHGCFNLLHCKKSGKIQRVKEGYKIDSQLKLHVIPINEKANEVTAIVQSETVDVTSGLTFNLSLTEQQKEARSNLQLPYLLDEKVKKTQLDLGNKGKIFYEADEFDDLDEEDPDDDLNI